MTIKTDISYIALDRFGYGARFKQSPPDNPKAWLKAQIKPADYPSTDWTSIAALEALHNFKKRRKNEKDNPKKNNKSANKKSQKNMMSMQADNQDSNMQSMSDVDSNSLRKYINRQSQSLTNDAIKQSIRADETFQYRLVDFFSNHFSVSMNSINLKAMAPTLEREAIAPNIDTYFAKMLVDVTTHPAMIIFLNNERSSGPNSPFAKKRKNRGLNENLAREILELHTLGVQGGYSQDDVIELAKAISGWSIAKGKRVKKHGFVFNKAMHEPGTRTVLGKKYAQKNHQQGIDILKDLSVHPSTAQFMSQKIAQHFIADQPPKALVDDMTTAWVKSSGHLKTVLGAMIDHPLSWQPQKQKFKTPRDFVISACRACGKKNVPKPGASTTLKLLGQTPFEAGSPAGYGDSVDDWNGAEALMTRIEWADHLSASAKVNPIKAVQTALGSNVSDNTLTAIKRAESREQGLALMLMSPEFLRR